jgi:hypothetical protein
LKPVEEIALDDLRVIDLLAEPVISPTLET